MQKTKKPLSLLLTFALLLSLLAGLTFSASAEGGQKVETATALENGGLYIIADTEGKYAMSVKNPSTMTNCRAAVAIEVTDGVLTAGDADLSDLIWTCTRDAEGMKLGNGSLYLTANYSYLYAQETAGSYCNTWALSNGILRATKSNYATYCVKYEAGSGFKNAAASSTTITLYKVILCDHENRQNETTVSATCTEDGSYSFHCSDCERDVVETLPALGHDGVLVTETDACWEYVCSRCSETYQVAKDERLQAMTLTEVLATFSTDGAYEWAYDAENDRLQSTNNGKGSTHSVTTITFSAEKAFNLSFDYSVNSESNYDYLTLTLDGTQIACTKVSGRNGETLSFSYPETELTAGEHTLKLDYQKDSSGNQGEDRAYLSNLTAAVVCDHVWKQGETIAPTCTEQGYTTYTCSSCGNSKQDDFVPALGHERGDVYTDNGDGTHSYNCTRTDDCPGGTEEHAYENGVCVCGAQEPVTIGDSASTTTTGYPYYPGMKNSTTQVIYTAAEIGKAGTISGLAYDVARAAAHQTTSVKIYMGHTDKAKFSDTKDYLTTADGLTLVYDGAPSLGAATGWETLKLDTSFFYNGVDNLVIAVTHTADTVAASLYYRCTAGTDRILYRGSGTAAYADIDSVSTYYKGSYVPNVQLFMAEHTHDWAEGTVVAPGCLTEGYTPVTCANCGTVTKQDVQSALGHDFGEDGVCTRCRLRNITEYADLFYAVEPYFDLSGTAAAAEKWTAEVYEQDPVAKSSGTNTIAMTALDAGTLTITAAQKNAAGTSYYKSYGYITITVKDAEDNTVSTQKIENETAALPFETVQVHVAADQTVEIYCYCMSALYFQYLKAFAFTPDCVHEHAAGDTGTVTAPTCTARGYTTYTCTKCQSAYRTDFTQPLGHDYATVCVEPTCTEKGSVTRTCRREGCSDEIVTEISAAGHSFENGYCTVCHEKAAGFVQIGESTKGSYNAPYGNYQYFSSQLLYTADKVGSGGTITGIAFNVTAAASVKANVLKVYMGHKAETAFADLSDNLTLSDLTLVYSRTDATYGAATGWETLTLDTPFTYNGADSLVIVFVVGRSAADWDTKYAYTETTRAMLYTYSGTVNADTYQNVESYGAAGNYLPDIQITFRAGESAHPGSMTGVDATGDCESGGVLAYWECGVCHRLFSDAEGKHETTLEALTLPSGGEHSYDAQGVCTVCGARTTPAAVAQVGDKTYPSLAEAVSAAEAGETVTLLADVTGKVAIAKDLTLDLGGHTLTGELIESKNTAGTVVAKDIIALQASAGTVTIRNGVVAGRVNVYDAANVTIESTLTIENHEVDGFTAAGIVVWGDGERGADGCKTPTLNFSGKIAVTGNAFGISTNGTDKSRPVLNVTGGEITADENGIGIYLPAGALSVTGGVITGATAIYFKSTDLSISGGALYGIGAQSAYDYYGNGANATGDALVVDNCNYPNGVGSVAVTGGSFHSQNALPVASYAGNTEETPLTGFVTGGTFNKAIENALCAGGFACVGNEENGYGVEKTSSDPFALEASAGGEGAVTVTVKAAKAFDFSVMELTLRCTYGGAVLESITSAYADASSVNPATGYAGLYAAADAVSVAAGDVLAVYTYRADGNDFRFRLSTGDCYAGTGDADKLPWSADYTGEDKVDSFPAAELGNPGEDPTGYAVTVEDKNSGAVITGLDGLLSGETAFTVTSDKACVVLVRTGDDYTRLTAAPTSGVNTYGFTVNVTADTTIIVALKGDVNGNGKVNATDSILIDRSCLSEANELYQALDALAFAIADVNGNGKVNAVDSVLIDRSCLSVGHDSYQAIPW